MDGEQKFVCLFKDRWDVTSPTLGSYQRANITTTTSNILPIAARRRFKYSTLVEAD